jgi:hypothetical protein
MARGIVASLKARGFDRSHAVPFQRGAVVQCSQCEALSINGTPCHERGCPNIVPVCRECGGLDPDRTCCQLGEEDAIAHAEQEIEDGQARWSETGSTRG